MTTTKPIILMLIRMFTSMSFMIIFMFTFTFVCVDCHNVYSNNKHRAFSRMLSTINTSSRISSSSRSSRAGKYESTTRSRRRMNVNSGKSK